VGWPPIAQGKPLCGTIATRLGANPKIRRCRVRVLAAIAAIAPSTGSWRSVPAGARELVRSIRGLPLAAARSALRANTHERRHRMIDSGRPVVFGVPFGARPAHIIEFGPIWIEQALCQSLHEFGEVGQYACPALPRATSNWSCHGPHPARVAPAPRSLRPHPAERPLAPNCPGKFVKNQYEFASDFRFVGRRGRKATVRVKDCCN
jgi:hypothetical protein